MVNKKFVAVQSRSECRAWNVRAQKTGKGAFLTLLRPLTERPCRYYFSKNRFLSPPWVAVLKLYLKKCIF
jgi:hypothetical protein